jgi:hypothetical protein
MPYSNCRIASSTRRAPVSVASISMGALSSKRRFGFRSHRQVFPVSRNARSAMLEIRATRTALSDSSRESGAVRQGSTGYDQAVDLRIGHAALDERPDGCGGEPLFNQ